MKLMEPRDFPSFAIISLACTETCVNLMYCSAVMNEVYA
jgi:hypothetical protein